MYVGGCHHHGMNQPGFAIHADVCLHPEIPLVAFARLFHIGITGFLFVLGGAGGVDDAGIHDRAS